ncbi:MAG TPA: BrnT family toxin [Thermoanaerobaculia bacterium]|nr:BrnT family toxin [Thermoanaerobaculia bacterium]
MRFEWDEEKRAANLRKHGIDFVGVEAVFGGFTVTTEDDRWSYGEQRLVTFGVLEGRIVAVVHTESTRVIRVISIRKATRSEEKGYLSALAD